MRKQSFGVGVERTFPVHSPKIERIEVAARGDVRRAKLYYLRDRVGKRARVRERRYIGPEEVVEAGRSGRPVGRARGRGRRRAARRSTAQAPTAEEVVGRRGGAADAEAEPDAEAAAEAAEATERREPQTPPTRPASPPRRTATQAEDAASADKA